MTNGEHGPLREVGDLAGTGDDLRRVRVPDRRRQLLTLLAERDRHTLTSAARALGPDAPVTRSDQQAFRAAYLALYHEDVPVLTRLGLVTYDDDETGVLTATDRGLALGRKFAGAR